MYITILISSLSISHLLTMSKLARNAKVLAGLVVFYGSTEAYLHYKTKSVIENRNKVQITENDDISKFKSASVAGMFVNPFEEYRPQTGFEFFFVRIMEVFESLYGNSIEKHDHLSDHRTVEDHLKGVKPDLETLRSNSQLLKKCLENNDISGIYKGSGWSSWLRSQASIPLANQLLFTWLGQSCSLIQVSGINILTDPILSEHLITPHVGPKRLNKSPMNFDDIKYATNEKLDFIMVSHDHPDHLENDLIKKFGNSSTWIVPLGLKKTLSRKGIYNTIEMDWWDSVDLNKFLDKNIEDKYEIVCVPSMHWSGRYIVDANFSLWCSYILKKNGKSILYHAGDTGYLKELFELIGKKHGPVTLSLLPIGQYCPSWHQKPRHISPQESLEICNHIQTKFMMGVHWGTFKLSSEPILEPKLLLNELTTQISKQNEYKTPEFGMTYIFDVENNSQI